MSDDAVAAVGAPNLAPLTYGQMPWIEVDSYPFNATGEPGDDTAKIQAAFDYGQSLLVSELLISPAGVAGAFSGSLPTFIFRKPKYKITAALRPPAYAKMVSFNNSRITQYTAGADIFYMDGGFRIRAEGITFLGGRHALYYRNNNVSSGSFLASFCEFHGQSDRAIQLGDFLGGGDCGSTLAIIDRCQFFRPNGVLYNQCDRVELHNCWVHVSGSNYTPNRAAFENASGDMVFFDMFGIPEMNYGGPRVAGARWVDNNGNFYSYNSRYGGEDAGMAIVYHTYAPEIVSPWLNGGVIEIHGGYVSCGPAADADSGLIHIRSNVPQLVVVEGVQGLNNVPFMTNTGGLNLAVYLAALPAQTRNALKYFFDHHLSTSITQLAPPELVGFFFTPLWAGLGFPATEVTSTDPNTLDDYEEGSWTPLIFGSTGNGTYELAAATVCRYQKIGNVVKIWAHIVLAAAVTGGGAGNVRISGLPFTMSGSLYTGSNSASVNNVAFTGSQLIAERVSSAATAILFLYGLSNAGVRTEVPIASIGVNKGIDFEMTYIV